MNVKELQRCLGYATFYRRFMCNFSSIIAPLTALLKEASKKLTWCLAAEIAFHDLKLAFTSVPILKHPDPSKPFIVDASETGADVVLSQHSSDPEKLYLVASFPHKVPRKETMA